MKQHKSLEQRKFPLSISVPYPIWELSHKEGAGKIRQILSLGMWAYKNKVNAETIEQIKEQYEEKIMKLQKVIEENST